MRRVVKWLFGLVVMALFAVQVLGCDFSCDLRFKIYVERVKEGGIVDEWSGPLEKQSEYINDEAYEWTEMLSYEKVTGSGFDCQLTPYLINMGYRQYSEERKQEDFGPVTIPKDHKAELYRSILTTTTR